MLKLQLLSGQDDVARLECVGDVTLATLQNDDNPLAEVLGPGCFTRRVLLSMAKATYLDTVGVGCLVRNHKSFQDEGGRFVLHSLPPEAEHLLRLLHLDKVLHLAADESAARALAEREEVHHA